MSAVFGKPLLIELEPSRQLNILLLVMHGITMISIVLSAASLSIKIGFMLLIIVSCIHCCKQTAAVLRVVMKKDNECDVFFANGEHREARLRGNSYVSYYLIILGLQLEPNAQGHYICLMRDSMDKAAWCRLRSGLRIASKDLTQN